MLSIIISLAAALAVDVACWKGMGAPGWGAFLGIVAFFAMQLFIGLKVRGKITAAMGQVQAILANGQKSIQEKIARWRIRPPGSQKEAEREIARDTAVFVKEAIAETDSLARFKPWVPMMDKQIATAKFQLYWMLKDWENVDKFMEKAIFADQMSKAMRLARAFTKGVEVPELTKIYEKSVRRARYNDNTMPAAVMSWILVQKGEHDAAFKLLTEALKNSDNEILKANHVHLMNNRPAHFSMAGFGDQWYSLMLEEPRVRRERQRMPGRWR